MKTRALLLCVVLLLANGFAFAGWRQPTAEEQAFHLNTLRTIASALPPCPAGWQNASQTEIKPLDKVYAGEERWPYRVTYSMECRDEARKGAGDRKTFEALAAFTRAHENDPQINALNKERERIAKEIGQAAGRNDMNAMQRLMKESEVPESKLKVIYEQRDKEIDRIAIANEAHDVRFGIRMEINEFTSYGPWKTAAPVAGMPVYRIAGGHVPGTGWTEDRNVLFISNRIPVVMANGLGTFKRPAAGSRPYLSVQLLQISVEADPERSRQILDSINWNQLKALVK